MSPLKKKYPARTIGNWAWTAVHRTCCSLTSLHVSPFLTINTGSDGMLLTRVLSLDNSNSQFSIDDLVLHLSLRPEGNFVDKVENYGWLHNHLDLFFIYVSLKPLFVSSIYSFQGVAEEREAYNFPKWRAVSYASVRLGSTASRIRRACAGPATLRCTLQTF